MPDTKKYRILVADDSEMNRSMLLLLLEEMGFSATTVTNGEEAVEVALEKSYDLILMDINMPTMSGTEATEILRAINYTHPIIACSAEEELKSRDKFSEKGFDGYLAKPIEPGKLQTILAEFCTPTTDSNDLKMDKVQTAFDAKVQQLQSEFKEKASQITQQLKDALDRNSLSEIKGIAHKLQGTAPLYGHDNLAKICKGIEKALKTGRPQEALERTRLLIKQIENIST
ncbi:response regulator [Aliikangiella coralliicola]|uniref:Response regulator n=1 Tax=Aliikangiella coralliicola TaxID=2592383 RepID=A0A545U771_9GAMM|nr:response regulator [Aliikangiella coralliicola]TQV85312.1 response regulator [Aliikangiella coralliicola]